MSAHSEGIGPTWIRVPGYVAESLLGSGASSRVWRGRTAGTGDPVALKFVEVRNPAGSDELTHAAALEAGLLSVLDHPNLIRLHEFVPVPGGFVLVLDLAAGGSLAQLLAARGRLSPGEAISALAPIGTALAHVHDAGVVHGDVSPANVLFSDRGTPMLADLGVSRMLGDRRAAHTTPGYVDPGVAAGYVPSPHSDVFMLAAVAVHVLTGAPLWRGDTADAMLLAALIADLSDIEARLRAAAVPPALSAVVQRALSIEPARRGSAAEFALDFRHAGDPVAVELGAGRARPAEALAAEPPADVAPEPVADGVSRPVTNAIADPLVQSIPDYAAPWAPLDVAAVAPDEADEHAEPRIEQHADDAGYRLDADTGPLPVIAGPAETQNPAQTRAVQAAPRPRRDTRKRAGRAGGRRRRVSWWDLHRRLVLAILAAVAVLAVGAGVAFGVTGGSGHHAARSAGPGAAVASTIGNAPFAVDGTVESLASAPPPSDGSAATSSSAPSVTNAAAATILVQLDSLREGAFARRAPLLLTGVYEPGALLDEDTAALQRIVPDGCGLEGVHTTYTNVKIGSQTASTLNLTATATLAQSVLFCNGVAKAKAPGAGPSAVHITLQHAHTGWLISGVTS